MRFARVTLERFREPEVQELDVALFGQLQVGRLQVAMNDRAFVRVLERFGHLLGDRDRLVDWNRPLLDPLRQRRAFHDFHDEGPHRAGFFEPVNGRYMMMVERRQDFRFALEARHPTAIGRELVGQDLERDVSIELVVAGAIDFSHPADPEQLENLVVP